MQTTLPLPRASLWTLFLSFLVMGIQSFGGGSSTLILIHEACLKYGWLNENEFVRDWALVQIAPGINLVKMTALIGHRLRGWRGVGVAMTGLLIPSALVTVLMTAGFTVIRAYPLVQSAMKGILPATIGLSLAMSIQMAQPLIIRAHREGPLRLGANLAILVSAGLLLAIAGASPVVVLLAAGAAAVLLMALLPVKAAPAAKEGAG